MKLGPAIRICRTARHVTLVDLAERTALRPSTLSLIENGKRRPRRRTLDSIVTALDVPPSVLRAIAEQRADEQTCAAVGKWLIEAGR